MIDGAQIAEDPNSMTELWSAIGVGDQIELEADLIEEEVKLLTKGIFYTVLAKVDSKGDAYFDAFVVESDLTETLVNVSPAFVSNYKPAETSPTFA